jgi:hypothetical protein
MMNDNLIDLSLSINVFFDCHCFVVFNWACFFNKYLRQMGLFLKKTRSFENKNLILCNVILKKHPTINYS